MTTKTPALSALFGWSQHPICDRLSGHKRGAATAQTARPHGTQESESRMQWSRLYARTYARNKGSEA